MWPFDPSTSGMAKYTKVLFLGVHPSPEKKPRTCMGSVQINKYQWYLCKVFSHPFSSFCSSLLFWRFLGISFHTKLKFLGNYLHKEKKCFPFFCHSISQIVLLENTIIHLWNMNDSALWIHPIQIQGVKILHTMTTYKQMRLYQFWQPK